MRTWRGIGPPPAVAVLAALFAIAACPAAPPPPAPTLANPNGDQNPDQTRADLVRDLEATVLEGYSQLSLGNLAAYGDTVADEGIIALVELGPGQVYIGHKRRRSSNVFRIEPCKQVLSRNLDIHLSPDGSVGWTFDEVSCRLPDPFEGRQTSIPLRLTAVYQRFLDSWMLVQQHVSYPLPAEDALLWAATGRMEGSATIKTATGRNKATEKLVYRRLQGLVNDSVDSRQRLLSSDEEALLLWPGPLQEYHGAAIAQAPSLESLFGPETTVVLMGARVELARNRSYAWVVARLKARTLVNDEIVEVPLRGSYVFRRDRDVVGTWTQIQGHVSAPVDPASLARRVFGLELPELSGESDQ